MIKEAYCSYEVSKLLKEKGFEGECIAYYSKYKDNYDSYSDNISYEEAVEAALKYCLEKIIK